MALPRGTLARFGTGLVCFLAVGLVGSTSTGAAPGVRSVNSAPVLQSFSWRETGNRTYTFEGRVSDEQPGECLIFFGGALAGEIALCEVTGFFSYTVELGPYDGGLVTAQAVDNLDQPSNVRSVSVSTHRPTGDARDR